MGLIDMALKFFHVHHEFRADQSQLWWEIAQAAMAPGGGWGEAVANILDAGYYNHSFCHFGPEGPAYCIWEVREGITAVEFQEFIDGPNGVNFGLQAWTNICKEINIELAGHPLSPESSELLSCRGWLLTSRPQPREWLWCWSRRMLMIVMTCR